MTETATPAMYEERIRLLQNLYDELFAQTEQLRAERHKAQAGLRGAFDLTESLIVERDEARDQRQHAIDALREIEKATIASSTDPLLGEQPP
jgi:uncharacterized coiled-coil DUF342 family protein